MPTINPHLQKRFKLILHEGQPEVPVDVTAGGSLIMCCPLCGCSHQITQLDTDQPYTPLCQSLPSMFKDQRTAWLKLFPEVTPFKTLHLVKEQDSQ